MKSPVRAVLIWVLAASVVLRRNHASFLRLTNPLVSSRAPTTSSPPTTSRSSTSRSSRRRAATSSSSRRARRRRAGRCTSRSSRRRRTWRRSIATARSRSGLAHPQGLTDAEARKLAREGKALRPHRRRPALDRGRRRRSTRRCSPTTSSARRRRAGDKAMLDNVILMLWPTINPDGQQMVAEWYMKNVGTPYELSGAAAALPGVRRPRQQPRRLHAEHDRVARDRAHVAAVGAADRLRAPPDRRRSRRASGCRRSRSRSASTRRP